MKPFLRLATCAFGIALSLASAAETEFTIGPDYADSPETKTNKGYAHHFVFSKDAGHTGGRVTRQTLAGALEWLWAGYPEIPAARMPKQ